MEDGGLNRIIHLTISNTQVCLQRLRSRHYLLKILGLTACGLIIIALLCSLRLLRCAMNALWGPDLRTSFGMVNNAGARAWDH